MIFRFRVFLFVTAAVLLLFGLAHQYGIPGGVVDKLKQNTGLAPEGQASQGNAGSPSNAKTGSTTPPPPPPKAAKAKGPYCKWIFDKYESSKYEEDWFEEAPKVQSVTREGANICDAMHAEKHVKASNAILGRTMNLSSIDPKVQWTTPTTQPTTLTPADEYMSRMYYKRVCYDEEKQAFSPVSGRGVQLIEPLFGMLRDPFDLFCNELKLPAPKDYPGDQSGQSKLHIMPQGYAPYAYTEADTDPTEWYTHGLPPWHSSLRPVVDKQTGMTAFATPQNIYVDLGSSYFGRWNKFNAAASGHWFYSKYHARGLPFNRFVAVELQPLSQKDAFEQLPEDLVGVYTLMNIGLTMGDDKLNAVEMIKRIVKPEDFFVFKLDIDSAPIEEPIVQNLLADDPENGGASALIDEFMFEHHVNYWPMNKPWKIAPTSTKDGDLITSYKLFRDLRKKGIRAHSWP